MSTKWPVADIPDQSGRFAVFTGAKTGVDYEAAVPADWTVSEELTRVTYPV
jgi:hypothetical protein